jgi:hypothetical protein
MIDADDCGEMDEWREKPKYSAALSTKEFT